MSLYYGREGPYLDLDLKIEEGKIKSKVFTKSEPIYLPPNSCHDPAVFKGFYKGIGQRLRLNCTTDDDFLEAVEHYAKALAISGHKYQKARSALLECKKIDRIKHLKSESNTSGDRFYRKRRRSGDRSSR